MRREVKWAGVGCAGLVAVMLLLGIIGAIANRARDAGPTPTAVAKQAAPAPTTAPATPTAKPTAAPAPTEQPQPTAVPVAERFAITGAGAEGVNLRAEPSTTAERVKLLRDGMQVEVAGENRQAEGRAWRNVKDPSDGATGWVAAEFVAVAPSAASKPEAVSPGTQAYLSWLMPKIEIAGKAMQGLGAQSELASKNPRLLLDPEWRTKTAVALAFMSNEGKEMQAYPGSVPAEAAKLDEIVKSIGADFEYIASEYAEGIDRGDPQRINNSVARMNGIPAKTRAATAEVERMKVQ